MRVERSGGKVRGARVAVEETESGGQRGWGGAGRASRCGSIVVIAVIVIVVILVIVIRWWGGAHLSLRK